MKRPWRWNRFLRRVVGSGKAVMTVGAVPSWFDGLTMSGAVLSWFDGLTMNIAVRWWANYRIGTLPSGETSFSNGEMPAYNCRLAFWAEPLSKREAPLQFRGITWRY